MVLQQFNNQFFHFTVAAADGFTLFRLEHDVLDRFYLCRRTAEAALFQITVYVCYAPFHQIQVVTGVVQIGVVQVTLLLLGNGFGVFVLLNQFSIARAAGSCTMWL